MGTRKDDRRTPWLEQARAVLPRSVRKFGPEVAREFERRQVLAHWGDIVGATIAKKVKAVAIERQELLLYTAEPVWANQLRMMMPDIVQKVNNYAGQKMIKELRFTRRRTPPAEAEAPGDTAAAPALIKKQPVAEGALARAREVSDLTGDEQLAKELLRISLRREQHKAWRKSLGYHPCPLCGSPAEPDRDLCPACRSRKKEKLRSEVRAVLKDMPWARLKDVQEYVPGCTLHILNDQRSFLVQQLAMQVDVRDRKSLEARTLVMLDRALPPEELTKEIIERTLYRLRFDLYRPPGYKQPKRYEVLPLGKKGKQEKEASEAREAGKGNHETAKKES